MTTLALKPTISNSIREVWHAITRAPITVVLSALMLAFFVLAAVWPNLIAPGNPLAADPLQTLKAPSAAHILGTDENGRDVFTRIVHGATPSLLTGLGASALALIAGTLLGVIAAQGGKWADAVVMRFVDILLAIPGLLLVLVIIAVMGKGTLNVIIGIALFSVPGYARLVRSEIMVIRRSGYVDASVSLGIPRLQIVMRHIVPNAIRPVLILATIGIGSAIGTGATLSFLGLGPQPPAPEWGAMLASSQSYFSVAWWAALFPGLAITAAVLSITVLGQYLQRRLDGRTA
ncbi:ABC transporter permease [Salinibacterium sp. NG253]|uniref:ABC transporter permease n=1 Tax=Salinibacterium sp. NG253 TaxID=2792039 RepID=UPI0018CDF92B|nr:ABC transporter permease [Salinibacterium sp. NG253]MBH0117646.1 ABC transporter permease [Salinibacterium sp. NG253]